MLLNIEQIKIFKIAVIDNKKAILYVTWVIFFSQKVTEMLIMKLGS
jgi:hypothetical protein